jgi:raffinose/stachyose/melibiose transport system substrate-binding protein
LLFGRKGSLIHFKPLFSLPDYTFGRRFFVKLINKLFVAVTLSLVVAFLSFGLAQDLEVWVASTDPYEIAMYERLNAEYAEAQGIEIEISFTDDTNLNNVLRVAIASGGGPDVSMMDVGDANLGAMARAGLVYPLTSAYQELGWDERVLPAGIAVVQYPSLGDEIWAVPFSQEANGLWYNAALFRDNGWAPPDTWDNFIAAAEAAHALGIDAISHGGKTLETGTQLLASIVYGLIPADIVTDASTLEGTTTWGDDPRFLEAVQILVDWNEGGWLPENINGLGHDDSVTHFLQGKAAMGPMGPWQATAMIDGWVDGVMEPTFLPWPAIDTSFPLTNQGAPGNSMWVSTNISKKTLPLALGWIEHISVKPESQQAWLFELGVLPMTKEDIDPAKFGGNKVFESVVAGHEALGLQGGTSGQWLDSFVDPAAAEVFQNGSQRLFAGNWTPEEFIEQVVKATNASRGQ